jgi:hypothetical protein
LERGDPCRVRYAVVECELCDSEPLGPVILSVIDPLSQVLLNFGVGALRLSVGLGVVRCGRVAFHADHLVELRHEVGHELGPSVTCDLLGDSKVFEDVVSE